jgi:hypothetical protein
MPVSLDKMMSEVGLDVREAIEQRASTLAVEYQRRQGNAEPDDRDSLPLMAVACGITAVTGQRCPQSGVWRVGNRTSSTRPIFVNDVMPPYDNRAVTWILVQND